MVKKNWVIKDFDDQISSRLETELKIHPTLCRIISNKGIASFDEARKFFRPSLDYLYDPFLMAGMDKAVARIEKALSSNEKILVYGDYDVDGTTSVAMIYSFFKTIHDQIEFYIPDRYKEGYGISNEGIDWAKSNGYTLIIALDCGIKANEKVEYANNMGIDFIICDHHEPGEKIPPAIAVLDPKRSDCKYPFKELSGCGIGFKLLQAYAAHNNILHEKVHQYLDLAAVSIASDIVPIVDENRILAFFGLNKINSAPSPGLKALMNVSGLKKELTISDIVFGLGPRINAAGRMEDGRKAVELLTAQGHKIAEEEAVVLHKRNSDRKQVDKITTEEALQMLEKEPASLGGKSTVIYNPNWHKGIIGIVASRIIEKYYRPTIVLTNSNGLVTGSARSIPGFNIYEAICNCENLLVNFGGHKYAAGLTLKPENVDSFKKQFEQIVADTIDEQLLVPKIEIDAEISFSDINRSFYNIIKQMEPFGPGNMRPIFMSKDVHDFGQSRVVKEEHLKLSVKQQDTKSVDGIGFNMSEYYNRINDGQLFDICYVLDENEWNGKKTIQLIIKDIK